MRTTASVMVHSARAAGRGALPAALTIAWQYGIRRASRLLHCCPGNLSLYSEIPHSAAGEIGIRLSDMMLLCKGFDSTCSNEVESLAEQQYGTYSASDCNDNGLFHPVPSHPGAFLAHTDSREPCLGEGIGGPITTGQAWKRSTAALLYFTRNRTHSHTRSHTRRHSAAQTSAGVAATSHDTPQFVPLLPLVACFLQHLRQIFRRTSAVHRAPTAPIIE
jgi:hypothetical protein